MTPEELFSGVRDALISDPHNALFGDADYAVRDRALVDALIARVLDRSFRGKRLDGAADIERVARRCQGSYRNLLDQEAARAEVEGHLARRYQEPRLSWEGQILVADHGVAPGPLVRGGRAGWTVSGSAVADRGEWRADHAGVALMNLVASAPQAGALSARIVIPTGTLMTKYEYRWLPSQDRLVVTRDTASTTAWVASSVGGDLGVFARGERGLHTSELSRTTLTNKVWGWDPDAPL